MTDDLVKRLRVGVVFNIEIETQLMNEAADRIEALEDTLQRERKVMGSMLESMTLRDQFAIAALPALMQQENGVGWGNYASSAYEIADMMMTARAALGEKKDG